MKTIHQMQVTMFGDTITGISLTPNAKDAFTDLYAWATSDRRFVPENGVAFLLNTFTVADDFTVPAHCVDVPRQSRSYGELVAAKN